MIKKITYIAATVAVGMSAFSFTAFASEISGTVYTEGSQNTTAATTTTQATTTSSEIVGQITMNQGSGAVQTPPPSTPTYTVTSNNNNTLSATVVGGVPEHPVDSTSLYTMNLSSFGPRYGAPNYPSTFAYTASPLTSSTKKLTTPEDTVTVSAPLPPFAGGTFGNVSDLTANAYKSELGKDGMTMAQLAYLGFIAVLIIVSMGYTISRSSREV